MTAQQLKNSILQLAVQGKLVPQDQNDEPASVLLEKIRAEKEQLIKDGKLKKEKPQSRINEDELPFDVPESWEWVRLKDLCIKIGSGSTPTGGKTVYKDHGVKFIRSQNVYDDGLRLDNVAYISDEVNQQKIGSYVHPNDILLNITGGSIGRCAIVPYDFDGANVNQHVMIIRLVNAAINRYVHCVLISSYIQNMIMGVQVGVSREGLSAAKLMDFLIPMPPYSEQKRILTRIDELLPRIANYDVAEQKLTELNAAFPDQLKKSILQWAVQGKLVPHDENEEPAAMLLERIRAEKEQLIKDGKLKKEKPLPPITDDEIPFDVPESWEWVRLEMLSVNIHYGYTASAAESGNAKLLRITDIQDNIVKWDTVPFCNPSDREFSVYGLKNRDIMIARTGGTIGKSYIVRNLSERAVFASYLIRVIPLQAVCEEYVKIFLETPLYWEQLKKSSMGTGQPNVNGQSLKALMLPLPPLAEQHRIVAKCEELTTMVERLR